MIMMETENNPILIFSFNVKSDRMCLKSSTFEKQAKAY